MDIARLADKIKTTLDSFEIVPMEVLEEVVTESVQTGMPVVDLLFSKGYLQEPNIGEKFSDQWSIIYTSIDASAIDKGLCKYIQSQTALKWQVIPLEADLDNGILRVAFADPINILGIDYLRQMSGLDIEPVFVPAIEIMHAIEKVCPNAKAETVDASNTVLTEQEAPDTGAAHQAATNEDGSDAPIIRLFESMVIDAYKKRASDIHIEPFANYVRVRFRIDGVLSEIDKLASDLHSAFVTRIKILANMNISEKRLPQDGRILLAKEGVDLDLRVSTLASAYGETVVIRILDKKFGFQSLEGIGMSPSVLEQFRSVINLPYGLILVTGPTGSGKSTTLYAALSEIDQTIRKVITVEDPVEYQLKGINQVQVRPQVGLTFANALRSILRQAPDVIMIGEIRDPETAQIAVQAALTGHLVLSTLHTNDACSAIARLIDMGVPAYLIASCIAGVLAQRLVRKICGSCKAERPLDASEAAFVRGSSVKSSWQITGCPQCRMTGYQGRIGIYEFLYVDEDVRDLISRGISSEEIAFEARKKGFIDMREDGLIKATQGLTTVSEVMRVIK